MKTSTLLILGAAGAAGVYFVTRPSAQSAQLKKMASSVTSVSTSRLFWAGAPAKAAGSQQNYAASPAGSPGVKTKDIVTGAAAVAAGAGCAAIPTGGALVAPLCGAAGGYIAGKAYDYSKAAYDEVASWF